MKREDIAKLLEEAGITDKAALKTVVDSVMAENGKDIEATKSSFSTLQSEVDTLKGQLKDASTTIDGLKKLDPEALQAAVDEWKAKATKAEEDAKAQVEKVRFDTALEKALTEEYRVRDLKSFLPHIDTSILTIGEDGKIIGLKEQVEPKRKSHDFLFTPETPEEPQKKVSITTGSQGTQPVIGDSFKSALRQGAQLPKE